MRNIIIIMITTCMNQYDIIPVVCACPISDRHCVAAGATQATVPPQSSRVRLSEIHIIKNYIMISLYSRHSNKE